MRTTKPKIEAMTMSGLREATPQAQSSKAVSTELVVLTQAPQTFPYTGLPVAPNRRNHDGFYSGVGNCERVTSSCGDSEGHVSDTACPSRQTAEDCSLWLHELSNLMSGVLLNAQMLEWKLPPYSHLKRPIREVARNAQRAAELMKRLQRRWSDATPPADLTQGCDHCTSEAFPKRDDRDGH
jgi:hypothetical protein